MATPKFYWTKVISIPIKNFSNDEEIRYWCFLKKKICFSLDKNIGRIWAIKTAIGAQFRWLSDGASIFCLLAVRGKGEEAV